MRWRISAWTHPEDAGGFKLREHSIPAIKWNSTDSQDPRGRATLTVPETYPWRDLITVQNPADPSDTSLIRLYAEGIDNTGDPDQEFLLVRFQKRITDDGQSVVDLYGQAWRVAGLDAAVVRWWDWQPGNTVSRQRDWSFGGDDQQNLLKNLAFVSSGLAEKQSFHVHASSGFYTLTVPTFGTTGNLSPYENGGRASDVKTALEAVTGITEVNVTGKGHTQNDPLVVEFVDPQGDIGQMTVNDVSLVNAGCAHPACHDPVSATIRDGEFDIDPWTTCLNPKTGAVIPDLHGTYDRPELVVVDDPDIGAPDQALRINPKTSGAGAQQITEGEPGLFANASIEVYSPSTTDEFTLTVLDRRENRIAASPITVLAAANTWETIIIGDMTLPDPLPGGELLYRIQVASADGASEPDIYHIRKPIVAFGKAAATIGDIVEQLLADAQTEHAPGLVRIPKIAQGAFDDINDSNANPWTQKENLVLRRGSKYGTHIIGNQFADLGYEYELTPNGATDSWDLEIYNEDGRGAALSGLAFVVGMGVGGGMVAGRMPQATRWLAEGKDGIITEAINAAQETATGVVEAFFGDPDITSVATLGAKAQHFIDEDIANRLALSVDLDDSAPVPYADFGIGDTVEFAYAGVMTKNDRRISEILLKAQAGDGGEMAWTPTITASRLFIGSGATTEALLELLLERERLPQRIPTGGGIAEAFQMSLPVIAASDAPEWMKQGARWVCDGTSDRNTINEALQEMIGVFGNVYMTPGTFNIDMTSYADGAPGVLVPTAISLIGAGQDATFIELVDADATAISAPLVELNTLSRLTDCSLEAYDGVTCLETSGGGSHMSRLWIRVAGSTSIGVHFNGGAGGTTWQVLEDSNIHVTISGTAPCIKVTGLGNFLHIRRNSISGGIDNIQLVDASQPIGHIWITDNELISADRHGINYDADRGPSFGDIARNRIQDWGLNSSIGAAAAIYVKGEFGAQIDDGPTEVGYGFKITENALEAGFGHGIELEDVTGATVLDNYIEDANAHGIFLSGDTDHCTIALNRIFFSANNTNDTWDMIHIEAGADENLVLGNTTRDSEAAVFDSRYALNVLGDLNIIGDNDFRFTGTSGTINDGGTDNELIGNSNPGLADWTPVWTGATTNPVINNGTLTGRFQETRKWVTGTLRLLIGSTTTFGTGAWEFDLPVAAALAFDHVIGTVHIEDSGTGFHTAVAIWNDTDNLVNIIDSGGAGKADVTTPITWATGDILTITFAYEVA